MEHLRESVGAYPELPKGRLQIEIIETAALEDVLAGSRLIEQCREFGIGFALDDFGTGYSSLSYLKRIPAGTLKIERMFVQEMLVDPEALAIVQGILGLASAFRVETVEQVLVLRRMGCELVQGYGIARPLPADQVGDWVRAFRPDPRWQESSEREEQSEKPARSLDEPELEKWR